MVLTRKTTNVLLSREEELDLWKLDENNVDDKVDDEDIWEKTSSVMNKDRDKNKQIMNDKKNRLWKQLERTTEYCQMVEENIKIKRIML